MSEKNQIAKLLLSISKILIPELFRYPQKKNLAYRERHLSFSSYFSRTYKSTRKWWIPDLLCLPCYRMSSGRHLWQNTLDDLSKVGGRSHKGVKKEALGWGDFTQYLRLQQTIVDSRSGASDQFIIVNGSHNS